MWQVALSKAIVYTQLLCHKSADVTMVTGWMLVHVAGMHVIIETEMKKWVERSKRSEVMKRSNRCANVIGC